MYSHNLQRFRVLAPRAALDRGLELAAKLADSGLHRPAGTVREPADGRARHDPHSVRDINENVEVLAPALPAPDALNDFKHPAGPFAARRAVPATLVAEDL